MKPKQIKLSDSTKILMIEDDPHQRLLLGRIVRQAFGCALQEAEDGLDALNLMLREKVAPNLILLDLKMPCLNGVEFLKILRGRSEFDHIPVIVCTALSETHEFKGEISKQIQGYLVKPIKPLKLVEKMLEALHPVTVRVDYQ